MNYWIALTVAVALSLAIIFTPRPTLGRLQRNPWFGLFSAATLAAGVYWSPEALAWLQR